MPFFGLGRRRQPTSEEPVAQPVRRAPGPHTCVRPRAIMRDPQNQEYYEVVCPYCLAKSHIWELLFRASISEDAADRGRSFKTEVDSVYEDFWDERNKPRDGDLPHILNPYDMRQAGTDIAAVQLWDREDFIPATQESMAALYNQKKAIKQVKDKYGWTTSEHICPHCHNTLPDVIGRMPNYIFSFMGNTNCGKTVYLYRLIHSIHHMNLLPGRRFATASLGEKMEVKLVGESRKTSRDPFAIAEQMFRVRKEKDPISDSTPVGYISPVIIRLTERVDANTRNEMLITLFDFPGEAMWDNNQDFTESFNQLMNNNIQNTNGWIFCLDATTFAPVKEAIIDNEDLKYLPVGTEVEDLENIDDQRFKGMQEILDAFLTKFISGGETTQSVAFVITKSDLIEHYEQYMRDTDVNLPAEGMPFLRPLNSPQRRMADLDDIYRSSWQIAQMLDSDPDARIALNNARTFCPNSSWFTVSATGAPLENSAVQSRSFGLRPEQPLEWLMWMCGMVEGVGDQCLSQVEKMNPVRIL